MRQWDEEMTRHNSPRHLRTTRTHTDHSHTKQQARAHHPAQCFLLPTRKSHLLGLFAGPVASILRCLLHLTIVTTERQEQEQEQEQQVRVAGRAERMRPRLFLLPPRSSRVSSPPQAHRSNHPASNDCSISPSPFTTLSPPLQGGDNDHGTPGTEMGGGLGEYRGGKQRHSRWGLGEGREGGRGGRRSGASERWGE